jgi:hypothetical protein
MANKTPCQRDVSYSEVHLTRVWHTWSACRGFFAAWVIASTAAPSVAERPTPVDSAHWRSNALSQNRYLLDEGSTWPLVRTRAPKFSGKHLLSHNPAPPEGSYTLVSNAETFVDVLTSTAVVKRLRLSPGLQIQPCTEISVYTGTSAVVDCQGSTIDLRCATKFHVDAYSRLELFDCHVLWSPASDFFNLMADTDTLRVEQGASLEQFGGSSTLNCNVCSATRHRSSKSGLLFHASAPWPLRAGPARPRQAQAVREAGIRAGQHRASGHVVSVHANYEWAHNAAWAGALLLL